MKIKKIIATALSAIISLSSLPALTSFAAAGDTLKFEAEALYNNGKTTVFNRTVSDSTASNGSWLCADSSYASVGTELTLTFTVPDDMTAAQIATCYKGKNSGRASLQLSINGNNYGDAFSMYRSSEGFSTTAYGPVVSLTPGEEITLTYTVTVQGVVAIDYISLMYADAMPEKTGSTIINEDFTNCSDNFGFPSNASVTDGVLTVAENMANYTLTTKTFDEDVKSLSKVDVSFDWASNLTRGNGSKAGLEFRDDNGYVVFAIASGGGGTQLRYSTSGKALTSDTSTSESLIPTPTSKSIDVRGKTYTVRFVADFTESKVSFSITDKETGFIAAQELDAAIDATNLSKMIAGNYYTVYSSTDKDDASQKIDNFVLLGETTQQFKLTVNYIDSLGNTISTKDFGDVFNESNVTIGSSENYYLEGKIVKNAESDCSYKVSVSDSVDGVITKTVTVEIVSPYATIADSFVNNGTVNDSANNGKYIFIATGGDNNEGVNRAPGVDADGNATYKNGTNFNSSRAGLVQFNIDSTMANKAVYLNMYVDYFQANNSSTGGKVRLAAYTIENLADIESTTLALSDEAFTATSDAMFSLNTLVSEGSHTTIADYITFDVSDSVNIALSKGNDKITFKVLTPRAGVYLADKDSAGIGDKFQGKAAYLEILDASTVTVTGAEKITKNGSLTAATTIVPKFTSVKITSDADVAAFVDDETGIYVPENNSLTLTPENDMTLSAKALGVAMVNGAQVRFGAGLDSNGKVMPENGLRFIATVDRSDTLASLNNVQVGMLIAPLDYFDEGGTLLEGKTYIEIPAVKYQNDTVFTAALTNLAVNNYNRTFRAMAYVKFTDVYGTEQVITTGNVDRSIYKVAAGLLKNGVNLTDNGEEENNDYTTGNSTLADVLQAYVNQVGIRLTLSRTEGASARGENESGAYTGDVFFTATSVDNLDGSYTITVTPDESFNTKVEINPNWWTDYVRINNNNSVVRNAISDASIDENGTLTFTFTPPTV